MILYIVRHGKPDYVNNCLLPLGWEQAEKVGARLAKVGVDRIYSSPYGRAIETARPLASALGKEIMIEDWAYELEDESRGPTPDGTMKHHSHFPGTYFHQADFLGTTVMEGLEKVDVFTYSFIERFRKLTAGLDDLIERNGYRRTTEGFFVPFAPNSDHIALFCHGGMMRVLISHLFNIPYQLIAGSLQMDFTSVTTVYFGYGKDGGSGPLMPILFTMGDVGHLMDRDGGLDHYNLHIPY